MSLLSQPQIADLTKAVAMASKAILDIYSRDDQGIEVKADDSPITLADKAAHNILVKELARITPDIPVISEENASQPDIDEDGAFWLVDPLDGTKEFINRNGQFTVNIGLINAQTPVFGIVAAPTLDRVWVGDVAGQSAYIIDENGERTPIHTRIAPLEGLTVVGSKSHASPKDAEFLADKKVARTTAVGSSLKFCIIAEGAADLYPRAGRTMEWDTAAGHAILKAAGGRIANRDGTPFTYTKPDFANDYGFIAYAH